MKPISALQEEPPAHNPLPVNSMKFYFIDWRAKERQAERERLAAIKARSAPTVREFHSLSAAWALQSFFSSIFINHHQSSFNQRHLIDLIDWWIDWRDWKELIDWSQRWIKKYYNCIFSIECNLRKHGSIIFNS